ncbi:peptidoglycan editing factor PgeF [Chelativorans intermedius]|uniref:Purine nucleoside phosphorylase n=1 Tax=Chelativorans intermedius TaxID=515947 RepID=A0ABV6D8A3_9HYPH|nr:peptidoglycan editing factor PgeF [Chelativorans intermedius]MCT8996790.1 peptidoglycan editing factor PgeF [Chelativorans intermedius]
MLDVTRPEPIRSPLLAGTRARGIKHGFFTRAGGVSEGIYRGLNVGLGSDDSRAAVLENRRRVARWMGVEARNLCTLHQCHSAHVVVVEAPLDDARPKADAMVTARPGLALGVLAADCGPVLFADAQAQVVGAAHAGWKGAMDGVMENTIAAMERLGARRDRIVAVLGPSISQENYEVGPEYRQRFLAADPENARYFRPSGRPDHALFDLNRYTIDRLARAGVTAQMLGHCTYADEASFFSYRRATHRGEPDYGRQISAICLEEF